MEQSPSAEVIVYPCDIAVKVMGKNQSEFTAAILAIFRGHFPTLGEAAIRSRESKNQKFLSLTITVHADNKAQMDALYQELTASEHSLFVL